MVSSRPGQRLLSLGMRISHEIRLSSFGVPTRERDHGHAYDHHPGRRRDLLQGLGQRAAIVFSHGWPLSADDWDAQMLFFLKHGYRVIAHDRRGHGRSTQV